MLRNSVLKAITTPKVSINRALIVTESHKSTEGEPMMIRRAKAFRDLAKKMPVKIEDWQLVVGNYSSEPFSLNLNPELCWDVILENMDGFATREGDKYRISDEDKATLRATLPWWKGKSIREKILSVLPEKIKDAYEGGLIASGYLEQGSGNFSADYSRVLSNGLLSIMEDIRKKRSELDAGNNKDEKKRIYYDATMICIESAIEFAKRYAELAETLARGTKDEVRKKELEKIASNCRQVPAYPARDFFEALQAFWFLHVLVHYESSGGAGIVAGKLDQVLFPYTQGHSKEEICKWLGNLWVNFNQILYFLPGKSAANWSGNPMSEQPTIGGLDKDGKDATNFLTHMMLKVERETNLPLPDVAVMYHPNVEKELLLSSCDTLLKTMKPKIFSYHVMVEQARKRGVRNEDLVDLVTIGCVASGAQGKSWGNNGMAFFNIAKVFELTMNNGIDPMTGKLLGLSTGNVEEFNEFADFQAAFYDQLGYAIDNTAKFVNTVQAVHSELNPQPFTSVMIDDCIEKGVPLWEGGARYDITGVEGVGLANVADALAAVKKLVYEEKKLSMAELLEAMRQNFKGEWEKTRILLLESSPKYGNDDDYVDSLAADVASHYCREFQKKRTIRGNPFCPSLASVSAHVGMGKNVGAFPDGRFARRPLSDGMSPTQGSCLQGPTAVVKSVTKIDHSEATGGTLLNLKLSPETLRDAAKREKFLQLLQVFFELGGFHVQFNIMDTATLMDAQKNPEKYPHLIVRVAAYVAQFGQLPRELQDDIIARSQLGV